jgi:hypothetical protein
MDDEKNMLNLYCCQFHQHYMCAFFVQIFPQSQNLTRKSCQKRISFKKKRAKNIVEINTWWRSRFWVVFTDQSIPVKMKWNCSHLFKLDIQSWNNSESGTLITTWNGIFIKNLTLKQRHIMSYDFKWNNNILRKVDNQQSMYRRPSLNAIFLSEILCMCNPKMAFFWNLSSNLQSSLVFLYANLFYTSLFLESLSLAYNYISPPVIWL